MRFFNLDLHVSVIADLRYILERLGHQVTDWSLSAHTWVFGRKPARTEVVTRETWRAIDGEMADRFYRRYRDELAGFDAFLVTHTPPLAQLYERWEKPVFVVASTRYEHPLTEDRERWDRFNDFLRRTDGLVVRLANNAYDAAYAERHTGLPWQLVPSLCAYTGARYTGKLGRFLSPGGVPGVPSYREVFRDWLGRPRRHRWQELADHQGLVHVPYNVSVMAIFEQYSAGIPMLFPTPDFLRVLQARGEALQQLTFGPPPGPEPIELADFYRLPHLGYFSSWEELPEVLRRFDPLEMHERMRAHNLERQAEAMERWGKLVC